MKIRRMRIAYCLTKATDTHWEYVIFNAFSLQQLLHELASMVLERTLHVLTERVDYGVRGFLNKTSLSILRGINPPAGLHTGLMLKPYVFFRRSYYFVSYDSKNVL